jgi:G3E family GTPase
MSHARYILVSGFLGAGKTTALAALARHFGGRGRRVGLITNDHGVELVDTATLRAGGFATEEVSGGSFSRRFNALLQAGQKMEAGGAEIVAAEPVGSSLDLVATIAHPLRKLNGDACVIAPISVLVDPRRAEQALGLEPGGSIHEKLLALYCRQLEEADAIVITRTALVDPARIERLRAKLAATYPHATIFAVSLRDGTGLDAWFAFLETGTAGTRPVRDDDDALVAEGEAQLGWLNATIEFTLRDPVQADDLLRAVGRHFQAVLEEIELLHLKIALRPDEAKEVALLNLTQRGGEPELGRPLDLLLDVGELIINLRAETHPEKLHTAVRAAIVGVAREFPGLITEFAHLHYFRPARLEPTHRMSSV